MTINTEVKRCLDDMLPFARIEYQEAKIRYNLKPSQQGWLTLEKLRIALEKVEAIAERWNK